jgi:hypothetical protein
VPVFHVEENITLGTWDDILNRPGYQSPVEPRKFHFLRIAAKPGATAKELVRLILCTTPPRFKKLQPLRLRQGPGLFAGRKPVVLREATSTAEIEFTKI